MKTPLNSSSRRPLLVAWLTLAACTCFTVAAAEAPTQDASPTLPRLPSGAPARVGDLGAPARLSIEGAQTFPQDEIRRALGTDLDYLVAAHPEATLSDCLAALENRVCAGYRDCGFRDVAVQARFDVSAGRIVAKVTEGPRFQCGALRVTGLKSIPVADFTRRFAETLSPPLHQSTPAPGIWETGVPVSFNPDSLTNYSAAASNTFAALGRFAATFKVEIQPQLASGDAALVVIVQDEGPVAKLGEIEVRTQCSTSKEPTRRASLTP